jgi:hypothetical protein
MRFQIMLSLLVVWASLNLHGQYHKLRNNNVQFVGTIGLGLGQENIISFPKLSGLASFRLGRNSGAAYGNFQKDALYVGSEASIVVLFAGAVSISGISGIKKGPLTADCALTRLWLANPDGDIVARQTTLNPKFGVMFGPAWLKVGPSFLLTNEDVFRDIFGDFMHVAGLGINLELNYNLSW